MIVKQDLFNVGLSREGYTNEHIYIEAENMEKDYKSLMKY